jgi:putative MATE family efflux protein
MEKTDSSNVTVKKIFSIAFPLIFHQLFMQLQIYVDRAMLGHVNSEYFSAIGNVLVPFNVLVSIIGGICTGTTIMIAQSIGAKNEVQCKNYAECSFIGNSIIPFITFLIFFFGSSSIFKLMGVQFPVLESSTSYLKIMSFIFLHMGFTSTAICIMQGIGITKIIMLTGVLNNLLNLIFDYVLIFGKFGFPQMGINGAALALVISDFLSYPILVGYVFLSKKITFKLSFKNVFHFSWKIYNKIFKVGFPSGIEFLIWNIGNMIIVSFLNRMDIISVGVYTLVFSLSAFPLFLYMGFANAALTLAGQKTGENDHKQAINAGLMCLGFSFIFCVVFAAIFIIFPKRILRLFTNDIAYINYAAQFFLIISITMFPKAINNVIGLGIRGIGDTKWMLYGQIFGTIFAITLSYIFIFILNLGLFGIFIMFLIDESLRGVVNILRFLKGREFFFLKPFEKVVEKIENVDKGEGYTEL